MKAKPAAEFVRCLLGWVPNVLVFAVLSGIGYWGYVFHWTIPQFSELVNAADGAAQPGDVTSIFETNLSPVVPPAQADANPEREPAEPKDDDKLPPVRFASAEAVVKTGIELGAAEYRKMDEFVVANGVVGYDRTRLAELSVRVPGRVWRVEKHIGHSVRKGDVLAVVESAEVGRAKSDFVEALILHRLAEQTAARLTEVPDVVTIRAIHEAKGKCELARVRRFNAMQTLANFGLPIKLAEFQGLTEEQASRKLHFLSLPKSIAKSLDPETCSANLIPLTAPFDAVVTECNVVVGELVSPEKPQFVISDVSRMWLDLDVRQEDARKLELGQKLTFSVNGMPGEIPSRLTWIGTEIDPKTRTVQARAEVANPLLSPAGGGGVPLKLAGFPRDADVSRVSAAGNAAGQRLLKANAYGTARIRCRENPQAVVAPSLAVQWQWENSQYIVFVPSGDGLSFQARPVRPGLERNGYTEILEGLAPGEKVVISGSRMLTAELSETLEEEQLAASTVK